ncbi:MAG: hypothetical protein RIK87_04060 [Fuerstiella sp.]
MKAVLVVNPFYFRQKQMSLATAAELGDQLAADDVLFDVVNHEEYTVNERGFPPSRSIATAYRLHWSRETSLTFNGKCDHLDGRLLFAGDVNGLRCLVVKSAISEKTEPLPVETPIVGAIRFTDHDCPAILKLDAQGQADLVILVKAGTELSESTIEFVCVTPDRQAVNVRLNVQSVDDAPETGPILEWNEEDAPVVMS